MTRLPALPKNFDIDSLHDSGAFINRTMQTYIESVRMEPKTWV
jgi:hypothetical protein